MKPKFSENELEQLYAIACDQGWDSLEQSERIALGRWCTRTGRKRPGTVPNPGAAAPVAVKPVNGGVDHPDAAGMPRRDERTVHGSAGEAVRGQVAACSMATVLTASSILSGTDLIAPRYAYASETGVVRLDGSMELVGYGKYRNTGRVYAGGCGHMHVRTRIDENHLR